ncbi:MAG: hypothetical protein RSH52_31175, partial [Janthinobacterium sp.]
MESKLIPTHTLNFRKATFYHRRTATQSSLTAADDQSSRVARKVAFFPKYRYFRRDNTATGV